MTRRLALMSLLALPACSTQDNLIFRHGSLALKALTAKPRRLTREDVAKYNAASISVRIGNGAEGLILLNRIEHRDCFWLASSRVLIVTRGGRLIQTSGLRSNLMNTNMATPDPVDGALLTADRSKSIRSLDFEEYGFGIEATSRFELVKKEPVQILGTNLPMVRAREHVHVPDLKWHHSNTYWAHEETGAVWRSVQHYHPDQPAVTITTLRAVADSFLS